MLDVNIRREVVRLLLSSWVGAVMAKLTSLCSLCGHLCTQEFFLVLLVLNALLYTFLLCYLAQIAVRTYFHQFSG